MTIRDHVELEEPTVAEIRKAIYNRNVGGRLRRHKAIKPTAATLVVALQLEPTVNRADVPRLLRRIQAITGVDDAMALVLAPLPAQVPEGAEAVLHVECHMRFDDIPPTPPE